ncbi:ribosome maturation factor RimP [Brevibacterium otitidis]|uniref:Ribosome maturation factor RimP n=1 Tax=Brevibacterium otitidis TaxID=53364 RepID=A0ABV5X3Z3_9MICO|nr:ribosome maturation factor RimP [Brevibacterium otitidis]
MDKHTAPVWDAVVEPLAAEGIIVEDITAQVAGRFRTLTVVIDLDGSTTAPVSLDHITAATRIVSEAIDELPLFNEHAYDLQVTSPGATRPLREVRHFQRAVGRTLAVRTTADEEFEGVLLAVSDGDAPETAAEFRLADGSERRQDLAQIAHAEAVLQFR